MSAFAVVTRPAGRDADDLDLIARVRAGDDRAFEALYVRYQARITAYVRGIVHDHGRAEDITQEVFISALRRLRGTDAAIAFKPWIYEIAKNACIDSWRRSRNANEVSFDAQGGLAAEDHGRLVDPGVTPDSAVDNKDAIDNLCGAFGGLSQTHHDILVMREFEGLSYREIGERLGMSRPGVESTLFRARRRLSEEYEELVSGERCRRVQRIVDAPGGRAAGVRDQRRMARHLAHCQPCRRYARLAGVDLGAPVPARPAAAAARIAAWLPPLPLPLFLRRRWSGDEAGQLVAQSHHGPIAQWSASVAGAFDPATVSGWSKAIATAATVAVAGVGASAAITDHRAALGVFGTPAAVSHARGHARSGAGPGAHIGSSAALLDALRPYGRRAGAPVTDHATSARQGGAGDAGAGPGGRRAQPGTDALGRTGAGAPGAPNVDQGKTADKGSPTLPAAVTHPAAAAPSARTTAGAPTATMEPLSQVLDALAGSTSTAPSGSGSTAVTGSASAVPQAPVVQGVVQSTTGIVGSTLTTSPTSTAPTATATRPATTVTSAPATVTSTATELVGSVAATVTNTFATTATGRTTP